MLKTTNYRHAAPYRITSWPMTISAGFLEVHRHSSAEAISVKPSHLLCHPLVFCECDTVYLSPPQVGLSVPLPAAPPASGHGPVLDRVTPPGVTRRYRHRRAAPRRRRRRRRVCCDMALPADPRVISRWSRWSSAVCGGPVCPDVAPGWSSWGTRGVGARAVSRPPDDAVGGTRGHRVDTPPAAGGRRRRQPAPRRQRRGHLGRVVFVYFGRLGGGAFGGGMPPARRGGPGGEDRLPVAIVDRGGLSVTPDT